MNQTQSPWKIVFFIIFLILISNKSNTQTWTQIGSDINGEGADDYFGKAISLSSDGNVVAIGAEWNDGNGDCSGHVRVFENQGGNWVQIGSDLDGDAPYDYAGCAVSLNGDGSIVAVGAFGNDANGDSSGQVKVFENQGGNWVQLGDDIMGENMGDFSGSAVSLNSDGNIIAIGSHGNDDHGTNSGQVRIYELSFGDWIQMGDDIEGEAAMDLFGFSVSLSSDPLSVAIGAYLNDDNGENSGYVRVFRWDGFNWEQLGDNISGEAAGDWFGKSVCINSNGSALIIGAPKNSDNGFEAGQVRIFELQGQNWIQVGSAINGTEAGDEFGTSVGINIDGTQVAAGAPYNNGNGDWSGHVQVFHKDFGSWEQVGNDIQGGFMGDHLGWSLGFSSDGSVVATGAPEHIGIGACSGQAKVYGQTVSIDKFMNETIKLFSNNGEIIIEMDEPITGEIKVFNMSSQPVLIKEIKNSRKINLSLNSGFYLIIIDKEGIKLTTKVSHFVR